MIDLVLEVSNKKYKTRIPEKWDEVPEAHFPHLAHLFLKEANRMNEHDKMVRTFCLLAQEVWPAIEKVSNEQLFDLCRLTFWVFEELDLSINKIPSFILDNQLFHGPSDRLDNLRFGEFVMAETYFLQYFSTKSDEALCKLIAALYRPLGEGRQYIEMSESYRGDFRERFNSNTVDARAEKFKALNPVVKDGIYLFYVSARWQLFENFKHIFPKGKTQQHATSNPKEPSFGWLGVFDDLCGEKGRTPDILEDEFVSIILMSLERTQIKWKNIKRKK